jgi:hypothetical protein
MGYITKEIDASIDDIIDSLQAAIESEDDPEWVAPVPLRVPGVGNPNITGTFLETVHDAADAASDHDSNTAHVTSVLKIGDVNRLGVKPRGTRLAYL